MQDKSVDELELAKRLSLLVEYRPDTGDFMWLRRDSDDRGTKIFNATWAGKVAGKLESDGYVRISMRIGGRSRFMRAHRLAWYMVHGAIPSGEIDHINRNRSDNRIENLRDVSRTENMRNKSKPANNKSGYVGVVWVKAKNRWGAFGRVGGASRLLGLYVCKDAAAKVASEFRAVSGYSDTHGLQFS